MGKYIDKDALVVEIERRQEEEVSYYEDGSFASWADDNHYSTLESIKNLINTFEVKEVDFELNSFDATVCKNRNTYLKEIDKDAVIKALEPYKEGDKVKVIIKSQKDNKL